MYNTIDSPTFELTTHRSECALRVPYDYASARQDYETVLRQIADLEAICERRSIGGVNSEMGARSPQEYLATAKKEKEKLDRDYERIAAAAAAAARGRQP